MKYFFVQLEKNLSLYYGKPCQRQICECVKNLSEKYAAKGSIVPKNEFDVYLKCKSESIQKTQK